MNYRSFCDNKGCRKEMKPVVDKDTLLAYCTECGAQVNNISIFMRRQMMSEGQIRKLDKKKLAWAVKCEHCHKEGPPDLNDKNELICTFCNLVLNTVAKPFAEIMKVNIKARKRAQE